MKKLSESQRRSNRDATMRYAEALAGSPAEEYLEIRGLTFPGVERYVLGYVADPAPGHEQYRGMLSVPYLRPGDCATLRFRCLDDHEHVGHGKYNTVAGDSPWLYNTEALGGDVVGIAEGELDAIVASRVVPTVGVPGVSAWQPYWDRLFEGYEKVYVFTDSDEPGRRFTAELAQRLNNVDRILFDEGEDVAEFVRTKGVEALSAKLR